jgi:PAS domain S-box-containing protein
MPNEERSERARSTLASSEVQSTLLGDLLVSARIGALAIDDGRYVAANDFACELTGYARDDLIGKRVGELNPLSELPRQFEQVRRGERVSGEVTIRRNTGEELRIAYRAVEATLAGMTVTLGLFWAA